MAITPKVSPSIMVQPPPTQVVEVLEKPEPAILISDILRPTQDQLAELSVAQQTVVKRNTMTPSHTPPEAPYEFTNLDRAKATEARKAKRYDWELTPIAEALAYLAEIRVECERGGLILQKRVSELKVERVKCFGCDNIINLSEGRWATMRTRNNFETGLSESAYACSAACGLKLNRDFTHPTRNPAIPVERPVES